MESTVKCIQSLFCFKSFIQSDSIQGAAVRPIIGKGGGHAGMAVSVQTQSGETLVVEVGSDATVADVIGSSGLPPNVRLSFQGRPLDSADVLADAGIGAESLLRSQLMTTFDQNKSKSINLNPESNQATLLRCGSTAIVPGNQRFIEFEVTRFVPDDSIIVGIKTRTTDLTLITYGEICWINQSNYFKEGGTVRVEVLYDDAGEYVKAISFKMNDDAPVIIPVQRSNTVKDGEWEYFFLRNVSQLVNPVITLKE